MFTIDEIFDLSMTDVLALLNSIEEKVRLAEAEEEAAPLWLPVKDGFRYTRELNEWATDRVDSTRIGDSTILRVMEITTGSDGRTSVETAGIKLPPNLCLCELQE